MIRWIKKNKLLVLIVLVFLLLNNLPYLAGYYRSLEEKNLIYNGSSMTNQGDYFVYLSYIEQGKDGFFVKNQFNYQSEKKVMFSPLWFALGQTAKLTGNILAYHIFRIIFSLLFIAVVWWWLKKIFSTPKKRLLSLAMILYSSGLGVFFLNIWPNSGISASNLWIAESNTFSNLAQGPLFSLSQILILLIFGLFINGLQKKRAGLVWFSSLLNLLLIILHPYDLLIVAIVISVWSLISYLQTKDKKIIANLLILYFSDLLGGLYYYWVLQNPVMQQYAEQNLVTSQNILEYIIGFGGILLFSTAGTWLVWKQKLYHNKYLQLMLLWAWLAWLMVYLPLDFNRRLSNGWHIPLAILSIIAIFYLYQKSRELLKSALLAVLFLVLIFDILYLSAYFSFITYTNYSDYSYYITNERHKLYQNMQKIVPQDSLILARGYDGTQLPGYLNIRVYIGHIIQTWQPLIKTRELYRVWTSHQNIQVWLNDKGVDYIFASQENIPEFEKIKWLAKESYIKPIIDNDQFILYQVTK